MPPPGVAMMIAPALGPGTGLGADEAQDLEHAQRLANARAADAEFGRERALAGEAVAGGELAARAGGTRRARARPARRAAVSDATGRVASAASVMPSSAPPAASLWSDHTSTCGQTTGGDGGGTAGRSGSTGMRVRVFRNGRRLGHAGDREWIREPRPSRAATERRRARCRRGAAARSAGGGAALAGRVPGARRRRASAVTQGDLVPLFADLPDAAPAPPKPAPPAAPAPPPSEYSSASGYPTTPGYSSSPDYSDSSGWGSGRVRPLGGAVGATIMALVPFLALGLFFLFGFYGSFAWSWAFFLLIPIAGIIIYGPGASGGARTGWRPRPVSPSWGGSGCGCRPRRARPRRPATSRSR